MRARLFPNKTLSDFRKTPPRPVIIRLTWPAGKKNSQNWKRQPSAGCTLRSDSRYHGWCGLLSFCGSGPSFAASQADLADDREAIDGSARQRQTRRWAKPSPGNFRRSAANRTIAAPAPLECPASVSEGPLPPALGLSRPVSLKARHAKQTAKTLSVTSCLETGLTCGPSIAAPHLKSR